MYKNNIAGVSRIMRVLAVLLAAVVLIGSLVARASAAPYIPFTMGEQETANDLWQRIQKNTQVYTEGLLADGTPITEQNINRMIDDVLEGIPDGSPWNEDSRYFLNKATWPSLSSGINEYNSGVGGCNSYARLVSDYIFGFSAPVAVHKNFQAIKPGDLVYEWDSLGGHWSIVCYEDPDGLELGYYGLWHNFSGNVSDQVFDGRGSWVAFDSNLDGYQWTDEKRSKSCVITRYGDDVGGTTQPEPVDPDPQPPVSNPTFSDVPTSHWAFPYVERAAQNGWVSGVGGGLYLPGKSVSYGELSTMLDNLLYSGEIKSIPGAKTWYVGYVQLADEKGLWAGTQMADDMSVAEQPVSRYEMAQYIANILERHGQWPDAAEMNVARRSIADYNNIPENYRDAVAACYATKMLNGTDSLGTFQGTLTMNRAQAAVVLCSAADKITGSWTAPQEPVMPSEPETSSLIFKLNGGETVEQMMTRNKMLAPAYRAGYLTNGKEITLENIEEYLSEVQESTPTGYEWQITDRFSYNGMDGWMSFGYAVSDFMFGADAPFVKLADASQAHIGDIMVYNGQANIVTGALTEDGKLPVVSVGPDISWACTATKRAVSKAEFFSRYDQGSVSPGPFLPGEADGFNDIPDTAIYISNVMRAADNGWMSGDANNNFNPEAEVSQAEAAASFVKVFNLLDSESAVSEIAVEPEVGSERWWQTYLDAFNASPLSNGVNFNSDESCTTTPVTRYEVGQIIYNALVEAKRQPLLSQRIAGQANLNDVDTIPEEYLDSAVSVFISGYLLQEYQGAQVIGFEGFEGEKPVSRATLASNLCFCFDNIVKRESCAGEHREITYPGKEATCTEEGYSEAVVCEICDLVIQDHQPIEKKEHQIVVTEGKEPTCEEPGLTERKVCSVCQTVIQEAEEIPANGHSYNSKTGECSVCGAMNPDFVSEEEPAPEISYEIPEDESLQSFMDRINQASPYSQGYLTNGEVISEESIKAFLDELKAIYPEGTDWSDADNRSYDRDGSGTPIGFEQSFTYAVSDILFGKDAPMRKLDSYSELRVGDIIVCYDIGYIVLDTSRLSSNKISILSSEYGVIDWTITGTKTMLKHGECFTRW